MDLGGRGVVFDSVFKSHSSSSHKIKNVIRLCKTVDKKTELKASQKTICERLDTKLTRPISLVKLILT